MTEATAAFEQLRQHLVGRELPPTTLEVERGHLLRFAEAIGDPNPLWNDEVKARRTRYGGLVAPPTFLRACRLERSDALASLPGRRALDAGSEWEYFEPIRPGDRITAQPKIVDVYQRQGSIGTMTFVITLTTYTNQFGQVVATQKSTSIRY